MLHSGDELDLERFVKAQSTATVMDDVRRELAAGRKRTHWMWFVFPQLRGLGRSPMAHHYGIASLAEARAYLAHPILGPNLFECTRLVHRIEGRSASEIFGSPDDLKLRSSMTLFAEAWRESESERERERAIFREVLEKYFAGSPDPLTIEALLRLSASLPAEPA
jgi:uncharacterized protein (DUF1810 family)